MTLLQVYHTLSVGGVGNYLLNLCSQLLRRGHRVLLAGPDGELMPQFEKAGVRCFRMPIRDWCLFRPGRGLAEIIRQEAVEAVHAHDHAAGPAAWLAARRTGTPYLLTIHCRRPSWQRLVMFYGSPKVAAVSPSLRNHLIRQLGLAPGRVVETVVGVDTSRFMPGTVSSALADELALPRDAPVLLHVSRFSPGKSQVALALVQAGAFLIEKFPHLVLLLAGSGSDERRIRAAAERNNKRCARPFIRFLGARSDVPELMRLASVVVGTGTVVLEAMACGRPAVAAGKCGFIGPVTAQSFADAREHHFGDHGARLATTPHVLAQAVLVLLQDPILRQQTAQWGRCTVAEQFSLQRMVDHVENVYAEMQCRGGAWEHGRSAQAG